MSDVDQIQKLREVSGAGIVDCKKALEEAGGDFEKALQVLEAKGAARMEKRQDREAGAGLIFSYVHDERIGVLLDLRAETDFVVRSEPFRELARDIAMQIVAAGGETVAEVMAQPYVKDESKTVQDLITAVASKVGENVQLRAFSRMQA